MVDMRYTALIRVRDTLEFTAFEAAEYIGNTTPEVWREWESNRESVPSHVEHKVDSVMQRFKEVCQAIELARKEGANMKTLYRRLSEFMEDEPANELLEHRIVQSALRSVYKI